MLRPWLTLPALLITLVSGNLRSQTTQSVGGAVQDKPGIALIKPQAWAKESEATVIEFQSYVDRTGYYEFIGKTGTKRQVQTAKVVKAVPYANAQDIKELATPDERQKVLSTLTELKEVTTKFPSTRTYLEHSQKILEGELAKYDSGQIKTKGAWVAKEAFQKEQAANVVALLKSDVMQAKPPSSLDLANDPKYVALKEIGASNPAVKKILEEITELHEKLVRGEKRKELMTSLASPSLDYASAESAVAQLKALKPEEEPLAAAFVKAWTTSTATAQELDVTAKDLSGKLETELTAIQIEDNPAPPQLSPELEKQLTDFHQKTTIFLATKPAQQVLIEARPALAVADAGAAFKALKPLFAEKQFLQAKDVLDHVGRQAESVGPQTERIVSGLQRFTTGRIEEFTRLREEGKLLAGSSKPAEALAKYEAAYAVIPDSDVNVEITKLKEAATPPAQ